MTDIKHNTYFDAAVQSLGFSRDDSYRTVGVMAPGEYHFGTEGPERITVVDGELEACLPDGEWQVYGSGTVFEVPGSSGFDLRIAVPVAYLCEYL